MRIENKTGIGTPTKILDQSGAEIPLLVERVAIEMVPGEWIKATIKLGVMGVDIVCGQAEWKTINPRTKKLASIEVIRFSDGTELKFSAGGVVTCLHNGEILPL